MPKFCQPFPGYSYRFDLGAPTSAVDLIFDVRVPGKVNEKKAVKLAKEMLEEAIGEEGTDFGDLRFGRLYFHPKHVTADRIVDIIPYHD